MTKKGWSRILGMRRRGLSAPWGFRGFPPKGRPPTGVAWDLGSFRAKKWGKQKTGKRGSRGRGSRQFRRGTLAGARKSLSRPSDLETCG